MRVEDVFTQSRRGAGYFRSVETPRCRFEACFRLMPVARQGAAPDGNRTGSNQPAHWSMSTDVERGRPALHDFIIYCTTAERGVGNSRLCYQKVDIGAVLRCLSSMTAPTVVELPEAEGVALSLFLTLMTLRRVNTDELRCW
jgi:hypothetical protein